MSGAGSIEMHTLCTCKFAVAQILTTTAASRRLSLFTSDPSCQTPNNPHHANDLLAVAERELVEFSFLRTIPHAAFVCSNPLGRAILLLVSRRTKQTSEIPGTHS